MESEDPIWDSDRCSPDEVAIAASISDPSGVAVVTLHHRLFHGSGYLIGWRTIEMEHLGGETYRAVVNPPTLRDQEDGRIEYYLEAEDDKGNTSQSGTSSSPFTVTVKQCSS